MTKIKNKSKIYRKYEADLWGFLVFKRKKSKINKLIYLAQIDQFKKIDIRFLEIITTAPRGKKNFFKTLIGKANNLTFFLKRYFVNLSQRQIKFIVLKNKKIEALQKKNISFLLESRIDSVLLRSNLFFSIRTIKQWINHGFIFVNLKKVWTANQHINIGDIISFAKDKKLLLFQNFFLFFFKKAFKEKNKKKWTNNWKNFRQHWIKQGIPLYRPKYLEYNYKLFFFSIWKTPSFFEIAFLKKLKNSLLTGVHRNRMRSFK